MPWETTVLITCLISMAAAGFVAWPLLAGHSNPGEFLDDGADSSLDRLSQRRDRITLEQPGLRAGANLDLEQEIQAFREEARDRSR